MDPGPWRLPGPLFPLIILEEGFFPSHKNDIFNMWNFFKEKQYEEDFYCQ